MRAPLSTVLSVALLGPAAAAQLFHPTAQLPDPAGDYFDEFGVAVAIDGDLAAVGAPGAGTVTIFERDAADVWREGPTLVGDAPMRRFGASLALDGERLLVGAPAQGGSSLHLSYEYGAAVLYERDPAGTWYQVDLWLGEPTWGDERQYGWAVDLDGDRAVVGSPQQVYGDGFTIGGAVHLRERRPDGRWVVTLAVEPDFAAELGYHVALDGDRLAVGEPLSSEIWIYAVDEQGLWTRTDVLTAPAATFGSWGYGFDLEDDWLAISLPALYLPLMQEGAVDLLRQGTDGSWDLHSTLHQPGPATILDSFGDRVALDDGRLFVESRVSRPSAGGGGDVTLPIVQSFRVEDDLWAHTANFEPTTVLPESLIHRHLPVSGTTLLLGRRFGFQPGVAVEYRMSDLLGSPDAISLAAGGSQTLALRPGLHHAGELHVVLGSVTGTSPGIDLGEGWTLPLVPDPWFELLAADPEPFVVGGVGLLDDLGRATAHLNLPTGLAPELAGTTAWHAFVVLDPLTGAVRRASQPVAVELVD